MGKYSRFGKNAALMFIGQTSAKFVTLLMLPLYTRWLSVEDFGTTDMINVYVTFLTGIISCCIAESIFVFPKGQSDDKKKHYFSSGIVFVLFTLMVASVLFAAIDYITVYLEIKNSFTINIWLIYGILAANIYQMLFQQFTRSIDKMIVYSTTGIILTLATAGFSFLLIPTYGVEGYVYAMILASMCAGLYSFILSKSYKFYSFKSIDASCCKEMLQYSIPLIPNGLMWWIIGAINRPLMESCLGMYSIGIYAIANKFPSFLSMAFGMIGSSWQISVLEEYGKEGFERFYNNVFKIMSFVVVLIFALISLSSELLTYIFTSSDFYDAWVFIPILTLAVVFQNISGLGSNIFSAVRKSKYYFYTSVWGAGSALALNFLLIPILNIWGAALSVALSFGVMSFFRFWYSWQYAKLTNISRHLLMLIMCILIVVASIIPNIPIRILSVVSLIIATFIINNDILLQVIRIITNKQIRK